MLIRFRFPEVFFGMLLAVAIFAIGAVFSSTHCNPPQQATTYNPDKNAINSQMQDSAWAWLSKDASGFFTFFLFVVGFGQAALFYWQLRLIRKGSVDTKNAADAAQKTAALAERTFTDLERPYVFMETPLFVADTRPSGGVTINYVFKNCGRTPAVVRWIRATVESEPPRRSGWNETFNGQIVFSKDEKKDITFPSRSVLPFPRSILAVPGAHGTKSVTFYIHVEITYFDVFGWTHVNKFCFFECEGCFHSVSGNKSYRSKSYRLPDNTEWKPEFNEIY